MLKFFKKYSEYIFLFILLSPIVSSIFLEYEMQMHPCKLCVVERYLHLLSFVVAFAVLLLFRKWGYVIIIPILANIVVTLYHIGVEQHIFESACTGFKEVLNFGENILADCAIPKYFLGLRLTIWNVICCLAEVLAFICLVFYKPALFHKKS